MHMVQLSTLPARQLAIALCGHRIAAWSASCSWPHARVPQGSPDAMSPSAAVPGAGTRICPSRTKLNLICRSSLQSVWGYTLAADCH